MGAPLHTRPPAGWPRGRACLDVSPVALHGRPGSLLDEAALAGRPSGCRPRESHRGRDDHGSRLCQAGRAPLERRLTHESDAGTGEGHLRRADAVRSHGRPRVAAGSTGAAQRCHQRSKRATACAHGAASVEAWDHPTCGRVYQPRRPQDIGESLQNGQLVADGRKIIVVILADARTITLTLL
jgi:hypothetical protein